jgi:hypothetical protein
MRLRNASCPRRTTANTSCVMAVVSIVITRDGRKLSYAHSKYAGADIVNGQSHFPISKRKFLELLHRVP